MGRPTPMHRSCDERDHVQVFVRRGKANARTLTRARVLLKSDEEWTDAEIQAAHLIAIACSEVPARHDHWTLRMLAGQAVELGYVPGISPETVRQLLKKTP